jgi:hypothetical protein
MIRYVALLCVAKVLYDQFAAYGESKWVFALACAMLATAFWFEMREWKCTFAKCEREDNRKAGVAPTGREAMCAESRRTTWRISYVVSFACFAALNAVRLQPRENLAMLIIVFLTMQGMFTFLGYHRYGIWC